MSDVALPGSIEPALRKGPDLEGGFHPLTGIIYMGVIAAALLFVAYSIWVDVDAAGAQVKSIAPFLMLFVALWRSALVPRILAALGMLTTLLQITGITLPQFIPYPSPYPTAMGMPLGFVYLAFSVYGDRAIVETYLPRSIYWQVHQYLAYLLKGIQITQGIGLLC